jgi:hypothetical protein
MPSVHSDDVFEEMTRGRAVILTLGLVLGAWPYDGEIDAPIGRKTPGSHAVLAVGTIEVAAETRTVIKNSWGTGWGIDGYGLISQRYLEHYARAGHVLEPAA